jgi:hypothetical protein
MRTIVLAAAMMAGLAGPVVAQDSQPLPEAGRSTIGYPSVAAALTDLKAQPDAQVSTQGGWTIIAQSDPQALWSFPAREHPAYPSAVRRRITTGADGGLYVAMDVHCEASKAACDDLVRSFQALNQQMIASMKQR